MVSIKTSKSVLTLIRNVSWALTKHIRISEGSYDTEDLSNKKYILKYIKIEYSYLNCNNIYKYLNKNLNTEQSHS